MAKFVHHDVAGTSRISRKELQRRLGPKAFLVWSLLTRRRDAEGYAHPSVGGLARSKEGERLSERTTQRALARLRECGLVVDEGLRFLDVKAQDGWPVEVFMRRVYGAWAGLGELLVPIEVWPRVMALKPFQGHGGRRVGAGRKKAVTGGAPSVKQAARRVSKAPPLETVLGQSTGAMVAQSSGVPIVGNTPCLGGGFFPSERTGRFAPPLVEVEKKHMPRPVHESLVPKGLPAHLDKAWRKLMADAPPPGLPSVESFMPPHPLPEEIHVTIPPPPRVPAHLDADEQLLFCARWYRSAVESRGIECPPLAPKGSHRRYFEDFRDICLEHDVRPGAWVAWALDRILVKLPTHARRKFRPPVKVLLSAKTLTESRWMFREEDGEYCTPRLVKSEAGEQLMQVWRQVKLSIAPTAMRTKAAAERVLAEAWPEGYKAARVDCAAKTAKAGQDVRDRIWMGEWIWDLPKRLRGQRGSEAGDRRQSGAGVRLGRGV